VNSKFSYQFLNVNSDGKEKNRNVGSTNVGGGGGSSNVGGGVAGGGNSNTLIEFKSEYVGPRFFSRLFSKRSGQAMEIVLEDANEYFQKKRIKELGILQD